MVKEELKNFFENYITKQPLFRNKKALQANYTPELILHRKNEINKIAGILAPALRMEKPSNLFLYGKTGTGKTLVTKYITNKMLQVAEKNKLKLKIFYLNCKLKRVADTEYRLIAQLASEFGEKIPATGLPTDEVYKKFLKLLENEKILLVVILDEIDQLVEKAGDEILYNLTRLNSEIKNSEISIIGISNNLMFTNNIDPRVKSSLSEEEVLFPPYNAIQLQEILKERVKEALNDGILMEGVLEKCAAYAAREHGDARRALELLRVAGEITERNNNTEIKIQDLDEAEEKIERDRIYDIINSQPKQAKLAMLSLILTCSKASNKLVFTGDIYENYKNFCFKAKMQPLTQRRISDVIAELDMLGIINAKVISKGRYGRTRQICLAIPPSTIPKLERVLKEDLNL